MQYTQKTFTLPAGGGGISQEQWDYATLSTEEFLAKYATSAHNLSKQMTADERKEQRIGFAYGNVAMSNPDVTLAMVRRAAAEGAD